MKFSFLFCRATENISCSRFVTYFNTMISKLFTSASESSVGTVFLERIVSESRWFLLSIRFQTIIVLTNIMSLVSRDVDTRRSCAFHGHAVTSFPRNRLRSVANAFQIKDKRTETQVTLIWTSFKALMLPMIESRQPRRPIRIIPGLSDQAFKIITLLIFT